MDPTSQLYALSTMRIDVDTPHQPHNTATIASCTYVATNGTMDKVFARWSRVQSQALTPAIGLCLLSLPAIPVRLTYPQYHLPYANVPSCDAITTWSHRMDLQVYLRFPIPSYRMRYSLTQWLYKVE